MEDKIKIFLAYHKPSTLIKNDIFEPMHVGRALAQNNENLEWLKNNLIGDDSGENISTKNPFYCELTAQYWAWKNCNSEYIGFMHYRRFLDILSAFNNEEYDLPSIDTKKLAKTIQEYDIIIPEEYNVHPVGLHKNLMTNYDFYCRNHIKEDLDIVIDIVKRFYPEYTETMNEYFADTKTFFFNMFVMKKDLYQKYCEWLFSILFESEKFIKISDNKYQKRVFGFLSERLLNIFVRHEMKNNPNLKILYSSVITILPEPIKFDKSKIKLGNMKYLNNKFCKTCNEYIDVVFATDNKYSQHCMAAMASILLNTNENKSLRFHILDGGINNDIKDKFEELKNLRDFTITFYNMKNFDFSALPLNRSYISEATYYRLYLTDILPQEIKKVVYLDCDIIVEGDLNEFWETDISEHLAAVVEDEGSVLQQRRLMLPEENKYFNAGVLLLNIEGLREFGAKEKFFEYFKQNEKIITLQDQDILNGVLNGKCKYLPLKWNTNARIYLGNNLERSYSEKDEIEAGYNPAILHYTDKNKPWKRNCPHILRKEYWKYLKFTPYKHKALKHEFLENIYSIEKIGNILTIRILGIPFKKKTKFSRYSIWEKFFSLKNAKDNKHKVITILGFEIKVKRTKKIKQKGNMH